MTTYPVPINDALRVAALHRMDLLDTPGDPVLDQLVRLTARLLDCRVALISLVDTDRQWFKAAAGVDLCETPREHSFCTHAILKPGVMLVGDAAHDPRFRDNPLVTGPPHIRFYAGAPLRTETGLCIGTLCVADSAPRAEISPRDIETLASLALLAMARLETLRSIGYVDQMSGLPNHHRLQDDLERQLLGLSSTPRAPMLLGFDVVRPQHYNDIIKAVGQRRAERFLLNAMERLRQQLPEGTVLYQIGTARFAAVVDAAAITAPADLLERTVNAFALPIDCHGIPIAPDLSIAIIGVDPDSEPTHLLRALVSTVDDARERGVHWNFYHPGIDMIHQRAFAILGAMHDALRAEGDMALHFQPRIDLFTGELASVEALLRWTHPTMGSISPAEFVPLAEKTALIGALTRWMLAQALRQACQWRERGYRFKVSLNVSAYDIERGDFVNRLRALLDDYGLDAGAVEVEMTENALITNGIQVHAQLSQLRAAGIDVAIDDFGTGYCNISYLKTIPASVIKIDQSFVRKLCSDSTDRIIVQAMIKLARSLGHRVVAEGIETEQALSLLREWGCDEGQGYLFARPMTADELTAWIARRGRFDNLFQL